MKKIILLLLVLQLFFVVNGIAYGIDVDNNKLITVVFRYDDPSAISNWEVEKKIIGLFNDIGKRCTFAVVPNHTTGEVRSISTQQRKALGKERGSLLKQAVTDGAIDIALHGYTHQTIIEKQGVKYATEFAGLSFDEQQQKLKSGKKLLEDQVGIPVSIFVPPFNTFDAITLSALEATSFSGISNDTSGRVPLKTKLQVLPTTCRVTELKEVVELTRKDSDTTPLIAVLFHEYDFTDVNPENGRLSFAQFESVVRWAVDQKDINILSVGQVFDGDEDLGAMRFFMNINLPNLIPPFLKKGDKRIFHSTNYSQKLILPFIAFHLFILTLSIFLSYMISAFTFNWLKKYICRLSLTGGVVFLSIAVFSLYDTQIYYKGLVLITVSFGSFLGLLTACFKMHYMNQTVKEC